VPIFFEIGFVKWLGDFMEHWHWTLNNAVFPNRHK